MNYALLRARARENLKNHWALSIAVSAIAAFFGALMAGNFFLPQLGVELTELLDPKGLLKEGLRIGRITFGFNGNALNLLQLILGGVVQLGFVKYLLKEHDGGELNWKDLFSEFDRFKVGFLQHFLRRLYVALWGLLFIIPGIVKSLSYAMTPYILAEHPELTASQAIDRSIRMMNGYKGELFLLHLTFFGWDLLCLMTGGLGYILLNPYKNAAETAFYRQLQAQMRETYMEF